MHRCMRVRLHLFIIPNMSARRAKSMYVYMNAVCVGAYIIDAVCVCMFAGHVEGIVMESYFTNTTRFSPPPSPSLSLAPPCSLSLPFAHSRSLLRPIALPRSPSLFLALPRSPSLSLALTRSPLLSFALLRSHLLSLSFWPRFPSTTLALPCSIFYSYAHAHSHTLTPCSQTRDHLSDGLQMSVIFPNVTPSHPSCLSHITPSHSSCLLHT